MKDNKLFNCGLKIATQEEKDLSFAKSYMNLIEEGNLEELTDLIIIMNDSTIESDDVLCMTQDAEYITEDIINFSLGLLSGILKNEK